MYLNDLEEELDINGVEGIYIGLKKLILLLYAADIVIFGKTPEELQKSLKIRRILQKVETYSQYK